MKEYAMSSLTSPPTKNLLFETCQSTYCWFWGIWNPGKMTLESAVTFL